MFDSKEIVNDKTYFIKTAAGKILPPKIVPFEYQGITMFAHRDYKGKAYSQTENGVDVWDTYWTCTEKSTGLSMSILCHKTAMRARAETEDRISMAGADHVKQIIADQIKQ